MTPPPPSEQPRKVRKLTFRKVTTGELYVRRPDVEAQIAEVIKQPPDAWLALATKRGEGRLLDETLVYLLRESVGESTAILGGLSEALAHRIIRHGKRWAKGFDPRETTELLQGVAEQIVNEVILKDPPTRTGEFLEVSLSHHVQKKTLSAVDKLKRRPQGHRAPPVMVNIGEDLDLVAAIPDDSPGVLDEMLEDERLTLVRTAFATITNPLIREAVILRYIQHWPTKSQDKSKPSLTSHFNLSDRQLRNWFEEAITEMRAAVPYNQDGCIIQRFPQSFDWPRW